MEPFVVILEVDIYESNLTVITYKDKFGSVRYGLSVTNLEELKNVLYNSHLRSVIPDLVAGSGRRKNKVELVMTYQISKALGFEEVGAIVAA